MIELPLLLAAFIAGVLMFLAPCTLPIVPGYLAFIGGNHVRRNAVAFVLGFTVVFVVLGLFAGSLGGLVGPYRDILSRVAGAVIILFGVTMLGVRIPVLSAERHVWGGVLAPGKLHGAFLMGMLFAAGWSPCIGPLLGTILLFASTSATALWGVALLGVFSLGLAIPFLLTALMLERAQSAINRYAGATLGIQRLGGALLVIIGLVMLLGNSGLMTSWALKHIPHYDVLLNYL